MNDDILPFLGSSAFWTNSDIKSTKWRPRDRENINLLEFVGRLGIMAELLQNLSYLDFYNLFMTSNIIETITEETSGNR